MNLQFYLIGIADHIHAISFEEFTELQKLKLSKLIYDRIPKKPFQSGILHLNNISTDIFVPRRLRPNGFWKELKFCIQADTKTIKVEFGNDVFIHWTVLKWRSFKITAEIYNFARKLQGDFTN